MGRGLAFGLKPGDAIDHTKVAKTFVLARGEQGEHDLRVLTRAPYRLVAAVTAAIDEAERALGRALGRHLPLAVVDHLEFVLERLGQGLRVPATMPELRVLYGQEFAAATRMVESISASLGAPLPDEEVVFLTMHLVNATRGFPDGTTALLFRRVRHIVATVEAGLGVALDDESPDYARFVMHVQFLLQRLTNDAMLRNADLSFVEFTRHSYPRSAAIAEHVKTYVFGATGSSLTDEEVMYMTVHVERLAQQSGDRSAAS
ncbi:transcriptional antiterminator LicT [Xylanimonas ulmi]